ncbi:MAG: hypothetical protein ACREQF_12495 [Candidatus Binataceae bacterium]
MKYVLGVALFAIMVVAFVSMRGCSGCKRAEPPKQIATRTPLVRNAPVEPPNDEPLPPATPLDPVQCAFADRFVAASNSHDVAGLIELLAPAVRECVNDDTRAFFERDFGREAPAAVPRSYTARFEEVRPGEITARRGLSLPVPPTHQLTITYSAGGDDIELSRTVALVDGQWYLVAPCPGEEAVAGFKRRAAARKEIEDKVQREYSSLDGSTRLAVTTLIAQGKISEAYMELRRRRELSVSVATRVLRLLQNDVASAAASGGPDPGSRAPER